MVVDVRLLPPTHFPFSSFLLSFLPFCICCSVAPYAGSERRKKRAGDRKVVEMALATKRVFESVLLLKLYPRSQIDISIQVLQNDGGLLCAGINATTLALLDAGVAMKDIVVACNAGFLDKTSLLDLNRTEAAAGGPAMDVAFLPSCGKVSLAQLSARLPLEIFSSVMQRAVEGCEQLAGLLRGIVKEHTLAAASS
jgi:exosome complex component RRP41